MTFENPEQKVEQVNLPKALERAEEIIAEYQIKPEDFSDLYDRAQIQEDIRQVEEEKRSWNLHQKEIYMEINKKLSTIFETIIFTEGESSEWFGSDVFLVKTSEYDDIINKADIVAEFVREEGTSRVAMAIDVTFNHDVKEKIDGIKSKIEKGELTKIKYFKSEASDDFREEIKNVPHLVLGADVDTVRELTNLWAENNIKALAKHGVQFQLLEQAVFQCYYFAGYAEKFGQTMVAQKYRSVAKIFELVIQQKPLKDNGTRDGFMRDFKIFFESSGE